MKKFIEKIGTGAVYNIVAALVALAMTVIGVYLVDEVFCYELECAIIWTAGTVMVPSAIHHIGEDIEDRKLFKK